MEIKLVLSIEKVNVILQALAERPYKDIAPLIMEIEAQGNMQINQVEAAVEQPAETETKKDEDDEIQD